MVFRVLLGGMLVLTGCASKAPTVSANLDVHHKHPHDEVVPRRAKTVKHHGHRDLVHQGHYHYKHEGHYDEHGGEASYGTHNVHSQEHSHKHGPNCGHEAVVHGNHTDYIHGDHYHAVHGDHVDEHGTVVPKKRKTASR